MSKLTETLTFNKWLTGFWEADGSIGVRTHNVDGHAYERLEIELAQKDIAPLQFIKDTLKLTINITMHRYGTGQLQIRSRSNCAYLLSILCQNVVSEERCTKINEVLSTLNLPNIVTQSPSIEWLAGFWHGDGTLSLNPSYRLAVTQNSVSVLEKIRQFVGSGSIAHSHTSNEHIWACNGPTAIRLSEQIAACMPECSKRTVLLDAIESYRVRTYMRKHRLLTKDIAKKMETVKCQS